jgi:uncharacterized protein (DUF433 family)
MNTVISDRGRGPEIAGTRITVYDIWDYARVGHHHTYIAAVLSLSSEQVLAALDYIEEHKQEVLRDYQEILDRVAKGNPPEVQAKLEGARAKLEAMRVKLRNERNGGITNDGNPVDSIAARKGELP